MNTAKEEGFDSMMSQWYYLFLRNLGQDVVVPTVWMTISLISTRKIENEDVRILAFYKLSLVFIVTRNFY